MASRFYTVVVDAQDPATLARFWAAVLDWDVVFEGPEEVLVAKDENTYPGLGFVLVPEGKTVKNRLHIDLAPDDRDAEVERIIALGATRADVGQGDDQTWVVLADPEGNEFCILRSEEERRANPMQVARLVEPVETPPILGACTSSSAVRSSSGAVLRRTTSSACRRTSRPRSTR